LCICGEGISFFVVYVDLFDLVFVVDCVCYGIEGIVDYVLYVCDVVVGEGFD